MENYDYEDNLSRLGIDPSIEPLVFIRDTGYPHHVRACQEYSQWMKAYDEDAISSFFGISVEDVRNDIEHIKTFLSEETVALNIRERNALKEMYSQAEEKEREFKKKLSMSPGALFENGQNPAKVLREFRKATTPEDPILISELQKEHNNIDTGNDWDESIQEAENRIIEELRNADQKPAKEIIIKNKVMRETQAGIPGQNIQTTFRPSPKPPKDHSDKRVMTESQFSNEVAPNAANQISQPTQNSNIIPVVRKTDRRVTLRLNKDVHEKLHKYSEELNVDISTIVRSALTQYLDNNSNTLDVINDAMPPEAFQHAGPFLAWGKGDLRIELRKRFKELLALAFVCQKHFPKTRGMRDVYLELLPICRNLGIGEDRQTENV